MGFDSWKDVLGWTVAGIAVPAVIVHYLAGRMIASWVNRSRLRPAGESGEVTLRAPVPLFLVGLTCFLLFASITVLSNLFPNGTATLWTTALFAGLALLSFVFVAEFFRARHRLLPGGPVGGGIEYGRLFGSGGTMRWLSVRRVGYTPFMRWFTLESTTGKVARISVSAVGIVDFAQAVLANVQSGAIDERMYKLLFQTANGNPPKYMD